jgi:hypothetical protein
MMDDIIGVRRTLAAAIKTKPAHGASDTEYAAWYAEFKAASIAQAQHDANAVPDAYVKDTLSRVVDASRGSQSYYYREMYRLLVGRLRGAA